MKRKKPVERPTEGELEAALARLDHRARYRRVLCSTLGILVVVAALAVLAATIWLPVLQIHGASMTPTLEEGDVVVSIRSGQPESGDLVAFYIGNKILVKRCIALPGQWVDMDEMGNVLVDGVALEEPYLTEKAFGDANITFPYQVPENRYFCLGDHRATSVDSRHAEIGCVSEEQLVGRLLYRVWPLERFGKLR